MALAKLGRNYLRARYRRELRPIIIGDRPLGLLLRAGSPDEPRPRHVERVIDQSLHPFDETHRMRQARVMVECRFVYPREWM